MDLRISNIESNVHVDKKKRDIADPPEATYKEPIDFDISKRIVIACGETHALAIGSGETLEGWGSNKYNQLGEMSFRKNIYNPATIDLIGSEGFYFALQVSCGLKHSAVLGYPYILSSYNKNYKYAITSVFTFGSKQNGRLGLGKFSSESLLEEEKADYEEEGGRKRDSGSDDEESRELNQYRPKHHRSNLEVNKYIYTFENKHVVMIACGDSFTLAMTYGGEVYSWGDNRQGALGLGHFEDVWEPQLLSTDIKKERLPPMKFIAAGYYHAVAISEEGKMYAWGSGEMGQLGIEHPQNTNLPVLASMPSIEIDKVACGMYHTMVISDDNLLFGCGANRNGQLGISDLKNRNKLEEVSFFADDPVQWVACGANHTLVVSVSHKVYAFGSNTYLKCGIINTQEKQTNIVIPTVVPIPLARDDYIYQVSASLHLSMAISKHGQVFTWGKNTESLLGRLNFECPDLQNADKEEISEINHLAPLEKCFLKKEEKNEFDDKFSTSIKYMKCGIFHTVALTNAGELFVWGSNEYGQHGASTAFLQKKYVRQMARTQTEMFQTLPAECLPSIVPQFNIKENKRVTYVTTGYHHIIAVENFRRVYAWGRNLEGQLGLGMTCQEVITPTLIPEFRKNKIREIAASEAHSLVLTEDGDLYAFGSPLYGRLGIGMASSLQVTPIKINDMPRVIKVRCGPNHSMALTIEKKGKLKPGDEKEAELYTWGSGWGGKLGQGHIENCFVPTKVETSVRFKEISCGENHSAGITHKGKLYIWGPREYFGLIQKSVSEISEEYKIKLSDFYILRPTRFEHKMMEDVVFTNVALGNRYNLALSEDIILYKWGNFDSIYDEDFKKITSNDNLEPDDKNKAELQRIERHCDLLKNTFSMFGDVQDYIVGLDCAANHAVAFSSRYTYSWGIDAYTGRLGHLIEDLKSKQGNQDAEEEEEDAPSERQDQPKIIKLLSVIFNRNRRKIEKIKYECFDEVASYKTHNDWRYKGGMEGEKREAEEEEDDTTRVEKFIDIFRRSIEIKYHQKLVAETDSLEKKVKMIYDKIDNLKELNSNLKDFFRSTEEVIVNRIISKPFSVTPSQKHIKKLPREFSDNEAAYTKLYTLLQLHPCYLVNIFKTKKMPIVKLYKLIKEVFRNMEGDKRKTKLFLILCIEILREELKGKNPSSLHFDSLEEGNNTTPLFMRLFTHFMKSSSQNMKYLELVESRIRFIVDKAINQVPDKSMRPYALVFKGDEVKFIMEKYKSETESFRNQEMQRIVARIIQCTESLVKDISKKIFHFQNDTPIWEDPTRRRISKSVKFLLKKCVDVTMETFRSSNLLRSYVEAQALALVFVSTREKIQLSKDLNIINLMDAFMMYVKGVPFPSKRIENHEWVTQLNIAILKGKERHNLLSNFSYNYYDLESKLIKHTFFHSTELENDKIQCKIGNIAYLTSFLSQHGLGVAVTNSDYIMKFKDELSLENNYIMNSPIESEAEIIVNIKLKTRQLLYGGNNLPIKVCGSCKVFLRKDLLSDDGLVIIQPVPEEDPKSLLTHYTSFLKDIDDYKIEALLTSPEDFNEFATKTVEGFKNRGEYNKVVNTTNFMKAIQEELQARHPNLGGFDTQKVTQLENKLLGELQNNLVSKLQHERILEDEIESMDQVFEEIKSVVFKTLETRKNENDNTKKVINAIKYGNSLRNPIADKILSKKRQSIYYALKRQSSRKPQTKELANNLDNNEKGILKLLGKYPLSTLKTNKVLVKFYDPKLPKQKKETYLPKNIVLNLNSNKIDKYSLIFSKTDKNVLISLIFTVKSSITLSVCCNLGYNNYLNVFVARPKKKGNQGLEEIIDKIELTEEEILKITELASENNEKPAIVSIGKFLDVNSANFLDLVNALLRNQEPMSNRL